MTERKPAGALTLCGILLLSAGCQRAQEDVADQGWARAWLDDSYGDRALAWVEAENRSTLDRFEPDARLARYTREAESVLTDPSRLPEARAIGSMMYNYWQDTDRPLGIWRRSSSESYFAGTPGWETVLDLDAIAASEGRKWIFAGASCLEQRCLVSLADNGKDAHEVREFDLETLDFVEDGFALPEDKSSAWWYDGDTLLVATSAGGGKVTESLLPSTIRLWHRNADLNRAKTLFEIDERDSSVSAALIRAGDVDGFIAVRRPDFFTAEFWHVDLDGRRSPLPLPEKIVIKGLHDGRLLFRLNQDWAPPGADQGFESGALVAVSLEDLVTAQRIAGAELLYEPSANEAVRTVIARGDDIFVELLRDYRSAVVRISAEGAGREASVLGVAEDRFVSLVDVRESELLLKVEGVLESEKLVLFDWRDGSENTIFTRSPAFDSEGLVSRLVHTTSRDGTRISYTIIHHETMENDGANPTLVYGYGGFDVAITPRYEPLFGKLWMEKGGVYVHAYLRGGGENGPDWHRSAMLKNRQLPYDDMIAVVEDLQRRRITSPANTGIMGRSNGGLMVSAVMMQRPELLNAVVVGGPLIDMLTYHLIPPGATWTAEYGDPRDPEMHAFIAGYSPLQQIQSGRDYPVPLIITSTDDDRVLPGHARRFAAELEASGHESLYFEDGQGGHYWELAGGPAPGDWRLRAIARAIEFGYLADRLDP